MFRTTTLAACALAAAVWLAGCASYKPKPLTPESIFAITEATRRNPDGLALQAAPAMPAPVGEVSFIQSAQWMRTHGPDVREAVASYQTAMARASRKTPLPNPGLEIGPQFGFGPDQGPVNKWSPFGSIGFSIPLGKRLRRQDEWNRAMAEVSRVDAVVRHRALYLDLREHYTALVVARRRLSAHQEIEVAAKQTVSATRELAEAGNATALDHALFSLEWAQRQGDVLDARQEAASAASALARAVGVDAALFDALPAEPLPAYPGELPAPDYLKALLIRQHGEIARLRARYDAAERNLRLEIAKQWPDLTIGPSFDNESGERRTVIGLTLGIEIPFFDRNEQAIAEAENHREEVRVQYEAAANRALADLQTAYQRATLAREKNTLLREEVLPQAEKHLALTRKTLQAGEGDLLRVLEAERSLRKVRLMLLAADLDERAAWVSLEKAVGHPLLLFPGENQAVLPPQALLLHESSPVREEISEDEKVEVQATPPGDEEQDMKPAQQEEVAP